MTTAEVKAKVKSSNNVTFHKFSLLAPTHRNDLFCFFEGNDSQYYSLRIKNAFGRDYHPLICGNKKSVLELNKKIKSQHLYDKYKTAFFVDRDFDSTSVLEYKDLYITPCYAIENLYSTVSVLEEILKNEFHLSLVDKEFEVIKASFIEKQLKFHESTSLFNVWYMLVKEKSSREKIKLNVSLASKLPRQMMILKIDNICADYDLTTLKETYADTVDISQDAVSSKLSEIKFEECTYLFRGKYEAWFMYEFLKYVIDDANNSDKHKLLTKSTKFNIDKAQMLSQLSQYAETPRCLLDFLASFN